MTETEPAKYRQVNTILVVDDDENWCFISKRLLRQANACDKIITAQNGLVALSALKDLAAQGGKMPAIILLDIKMPVLDGFGFLKALESETHLDLSETKVYICSSSLHPRDKQTAEDFAVAGFITKPLTKEMLTDILR
ncbi:response regulator [uncultured Pontibacter sp.]|uniref:response regulator n=1 Tax=uncultured Pontibacter sp. TaxID=453356 RepID=UPI00261D518F|nr:response regulator [uncultured Pontibacter sp.]